VYFTHTPNFAFNHFAQHTDILYTSSPRRNREGWIVVWETSSQVKYAMQNEYLQDLFEDFDVMIILCFLCVGLIHAATLSVVFNRTLLVESGFDTFHRMFDLYDGKNIVRYLPKDLRTRGNSNKTRIITAFISLFFSF